MEYVSIIYEKNAVKDFIYLVWIKIIYLFIYGIHLFVLEICDYYFEFIVVIYLYEFFFFILLNWSIWTIKQEKKCLIYKYEAVINYQVQIFNKKRQFKILCSNMIKNVEQKMPQLPIRY